MGLGTALLSWKATDSSPKLPLPIHTFLGCNPQTLVGGQERASFIQASSCSVQELKVRPANTCVQDGSL